MKKPVGSGLIRERRRGWKAYSALAQNERNARLRVVLEKFAREERRRYEHLRRIFPDAKEAKMPFESLFIYLLVLSRRAFGIAFAAKLLERLWNFTSTRCTIELKEGKMDAVQQKEIKVFLDDNAEWKTQMAKELREYENQLEYVRSIILGLNDGLVEVLAAVAGLAVVATSSTVVVIGGIIIGVSGTLSMAAGVYLASRSDTIVDSASSRMKKGISPRNEGIYTGIYYFLGALVPVIPFIFGASGFYGIALAIILVCVALTLASTIIAVIGGSSIRKRVAEMIIISLSAALVTILLGLVLRSYGVILT